MHRGPESSPLIGFKMDQQNVPLTCKSHILELQHSAFYSLELHAQCPTAVQGYFSSFWMNVGTWWEGNKSKQGRGETYPLMAKKVLIMLHQVNKLAVFFKETGVQETRTCREELMGAHKRADKRHDNHGRKASASLFT